MKLIFLVLAMMGLSVGLSFAAADGGIKGKNIKVSGEGKITAVPDEAIIQVTVKEEGETLNGLVEKAKVQMNSLLASLKSFDIPKEDLQTTQYSVEPKYQYTKGTTKAIGYVVTNRLKVVLKDISKIDDVLGDMSNGDANQVEGPTFGFSDPAKLQLQALKAAVENAHSKAAVLAESAGAVLGPVYSIEQTGVNIPTFRYAMSARAMADAAPAPVPVEQGTDQVTAQIEVVYTLK
ncbi:MAG TPA: SIMPL domain-containing protein [bacterium]|jgi:uncharacterized protein YggE|nr:SIMPL domain-containing protein [bacterium]